MVRMEFTQLCPFFILCTFYAACYAKMVEELKSNTGDVSLSINIPSIAITDLLGTKTNSETRENINANNETSSVEAKEDKSEAKGSKSLDLAKLLSSGKPLSIKSTETSTMGEKGNTEKSVKEIAIDTPGDVETKSNSKQGDESQMDDKTVAKLVSALKTGLFNSSSSQNSATQEVKSNPSSGLTSSEDQVSKVNDSPKEAKGLKDKNTKENGAEVASESESKQLSSEGSRATKETSEGNQIALVPVSLPSSVMSQLQSAISGNSNMSANGGNVTSLLPPALASLLGKTMSKINDNNTVGNEKSNAKSNDTNAELTENASNESSTMLSNSSNAENEEREGSKMNKKKDNGEGKNTEAKSAAKQTDSSSSPESNPMKKDTPVLVVIPSISNTPKALSEPKSGFFSKKVTSLRVRSGLHKKSKLKYTSKE